MKTWLIDACVSVNFFFPLWKVLIVNDNEKSLMNYTDHGFPMIRWKECSIMLPNFTCIFVLDFVDIECYKHIILMYVSSFLLCLHYYFSYCFLLRYSVTNGRPYYFRPVFIIILSFQTEIPNCVRTVSNQGILFSTEKNVVFVLFLIKAFRFQQITL